LELGGNLDHGVPHINKETGELTITPKDLTPFEQILLVKVFMHAIPCRHQVAIIFGIHCTTAGTYIDKWAPCWAKYG
jgi:hypothetical protein